MLDFEYSQLMPLIYRYHVASSLPYGGGKRQVFFFIRDSFTFRARTYSIISC